MLRQLVTHFQKRVQAIPPELDRTKSLGPKNALLGVFYNQHAVSKI